MCSSHWPYSPTDMRQGVRGRGSSKVLSRCWMGKLWLWLRWFCKVDCLWHRSVSYRHDSSSSSSSSSADDEAGPSGWWWFDKAAIDDDVDGLCLPASSECDAPRSWKTDFSTTPRHNLLLRWHKNLFGAPTCHLFVRHLSQTPSHLRQKLLRPRVSEPPEKLSPAERAYLSCSLGRTGPGDDTLPKVSTTVTSQYCVQSSKDSNVKTARFLSSSPTRQCGSFML